MGRLEIEDLRFLDRGPIDLTIDAGECVSLSGASGSGKTLLLRALADLDRHDGSIRLDGVDASKMPAPAWRRRVGMLPAESGWWADRVSAHFPQGLELEAMLGSVGFDPGVLRWSVQRLSTGERQRLALVRLLANRPEALLLDEPTASLDPENVDRAEALIDAYRRRENAACLWVSHDPGQASRVGSRHFALRAGRLEPASHG